MQDNIRTAGHTFDVELPTGRMEQGQQFRCPSADVLMRLPSRLSDWLPSLAQVWDRLIGSGFIFDVHGEPCLLRVQVGLLDQLFFYDGKVCLRS